VSVAEIVSAVDDPLTGDEAGLSPELWRQLAELMLTHRATITLDSLVEPHRAQGADIQPARRRRLPEHTPLSATLGARRPSGPNSVFDFGRSFARGG
jgi:hypothetical protein